MKHLKKMSKISPPAVAGVPAKMKPAKLKPTSA